MLIAYGIWVYKWDKECHLVFRYLRECPPLLPYLPPILIPNWRCRSLWNIKWRGLYHNNGRGTTTNMVTKQKLIWSIRMCYEECTLGIFSRIKGVLNGIDDRDPYLLLHQNKVPTSFWSLGHWLFVQQCRRQCRRLQWCSTCCLVFLKSV